MRKGTLYDLQLPWINFIAKEFSFVLSHVSITNAILCFNFCFACDKVTY